MGLRRRLAELEARVAALEAERFDGAMPPRATVDSAPVDAQALWRGSTAEYAAIQMEEVSDDRAVGVYL